MKQFEKDILAAKRILDRQKPPKSARLWTFDDNGDLVLLRDYAKQWRKNQKRGKK
jgi:hypothetical protein